MSVRFDGAVIRLEGECRVEDAEPLVLLLQENAHATVDIGACRLLHGALAQALLRFRPAIVGRPDDPFLRDLVLPNLTAGPIESGGNDDHAF